jgi:hypothetical protein
LAIFAGPAALVGIELLVPAEMGIALTVPGVCATMLDANVQTSAINRRQLRFVPRHSPQTNRIWSGV